MKKVEIGTNIKKLLQTHFPKEEKKARPDKTSLTSSSLAWIKRATKVPN